MPSAQSMMEVPSGRLSAVLGPNNGDTLKHIQKLAGAECQVQPQLPGSDKVLLTISGSQASIEKCRAFLTALIAGDLQELNRLIAPTGVSVNAAAAAAAAAPVQAPVPSVGQGGVLTGYGGMLQPPVAQQALAPSGLAGLVAALTAKAPPAANDAVPAAGSAVAPPLPRAPAPAGLPQAPMLSQLLAATGHGVSPPTESGAFDKEALQRLATTSPAPAAPAPVPEIEAPPLPRAVQRPRRTFDAEPPAAAVAFAQAVVPAAPKDTPVSSLPATVRATPPEAPQENGSASTKSSQWEALASKFKGTGTSSQERQLLERDVLETLPHLDPSRQVELLASVFAGDSFRSEGFLDDVSQVMSGTVPKLKSAEITHAMSIIADSARAVGQRASSSRSLGTDGGRPPRLSEPLRSFFNAATREVSLRIMDAPPSALAQMATALASVGLGSAKSFSGLARGAVARADRFPLTDLVALVSAFAAAGLFHSKLFEAMCKALRHHSELPLQELVCGFRSLATCGVRDGALAQAAGDYLTKKLAKSPAALAAEDFCSLAWSFCALDHHHAAMFKSFFHALENAAVVQNDTLCELYEMHLFLKAFHQASYSDVELEDETVQSLKEHYQQVGANGAQERRASKILQEVSEALSEVVDGSIVRAFETSLGCVVDLAITKKRNSTTPLVCLEVDGSHSLVRAVDQSDNASSANVVRPRGGVALKRRLLQKHGFAVAVVTEDEWRGCDKEREKRERLREILSKAGLSQDRLRR